jgi:hypothetical protein
LTRGPGIGSACKPRSVPRTQPVYGLAAFVPHVRGWVIISLGSRVAAELEQPTRGSEGTGRPLIPEDRCPCLALLPAGVAWPHPLLAAPVVSYTTVSP